MGEVIYDPIKSQIYITYAKGNPERTRPERKRKMIQKIVNPKNKWEWNKNKNYTIKYK